MEEATTASEVLAGALFAILAIVAFALAFVLGGGALSGARDLVIGNVTRYPGWEVLLCAASAGLATVSGGAGMIAYAAASRRLRGKRD